MPRDTTPPQAQEWQAARDRMRLSTYIIAAEVLRIREILDGKQWQHSARRTAWPTLADLQEAQSMLAQMQADVAAVIASEGKAWIADARTGLS